MALSLIVGPANAGKVELLLDRYLAAVDRDAFLIVPGGADVERVERELLARTGALLAGSIGTFDDLFVAIATGDPESSRVLTDAQRALAVRPAGGSTSSRRGSRRSRTLRSRTSSGRSSRSRAPSRRSSRARSASSKAPVRGVRSSSSPRSSSS